MNKDAAAFKVKSTGQKSAFATYRQIVYGPISLTRLTYTELITNLLGGLRGAPGLALRKIAYPQLFSRCGTKTLFGRNISLRHAAKIRIGERSIIDDNVLLDAKGDDNRGIDIGDNVYIGRNTLIYCKNGNIRIGDNVNISSNCQIFSSGDLIIEHDTVIAAFCYLLNGGSYDMHSPVPFSQQTGMNSSGPTTIGPNCWIAAHSTITDGVTIGQHSVIAAGSVVTRDIPPDTLAAGTPAKCKRNIQIDHANPRPAN